MEETISEEIDLKDEVYITPVIKESENGEKQIFFEGVFSEADSLNGNKRLYPKPVLRAVYNEAMERSRKTGVPIFGELEHAKDAHVNPERIAVKFPEFVWNEETGQITGRAIPILTDAGQQVEKLARSGFPICFSTRMTGRVKPMTEERKREFNITEDCVEVCEGAKLISVDVVGTPSCQKAITQTVYEEQEALEKTNSKKKSFKSIFDSLMK